jgi:hypothetical protein
MNATTRLLSRPPERYDRDVGDERPAHRPREHRLGLRQGVVAVERLAPRLRGQLPVRLLRHLAVGTDAQHVAGPELVDPAEERPGRRDGPERQVRIDRVLVQRRGDARREQGLHLRREEEPLAVGVPVEGQDAHAVAREPKLARPLVVEGERELADHRREAGRPAAAADLEEHLRVALGPEDGAVGEELLTKLDVVEDLAVEGEMAGTVRGRHRLGGPDGVDDREPGVAEPDGAPGAEAVAVGAAVRQAGRHRPERGLVGRPAVETAHPHDAAHALSPDPGGRRAVRARGRTRG